MKVYQYEMTELVYQAPAPEGNEVSVELSAEFVCGEERRSVKGFYAGDGEYKIRFLPEQAGEYRYEVRGVVRDEGVFTAEPAREGQHGIVRAKGRSFAYEDGTPGLFFGTTVYALMHQSRALIDETMETLRQAPFNKIRLCVFPKHYRYNHNEPEFYAFAGKSGEWDTAHPDMRFWGAFEQRLQQLFDMGIQVDLILFHPYDRWGFASMSQQQNLEYLDYLLRRLSAWPALWWSMANEYDLCRAKSMEDWYEIEEFIAANDPYHHLLSNHNCFAPYDASRPNITHMSWQTRQLERAAEMQKRYDKPVSIDECCYEGDLPESWGAISGEEMTARFWRAFMQGASCTHGETFYPGEDEVVWWARGGKLRGESPERIRFLRGVMESLPGPLTPQPAPLCAIAGMTEQEREAALEQAGEFGFFLRAALRIPGEEFERWAGKETELIAACGNQAILHYYDIQTSSRVTVKLPEDAHYRLEVIDTWNMTRTPAAEDASGETEVMLTGKPWMAVLAIRL